MEFMEIMNAENTIISFAGVDKEDVAYFLARLLGTCDEPVLVIDNSDKHCVYRIVAENGKTEETYLRNITFIKDAAFSERTIEDFRYVLVYHGMDVDMMWWMNSDHKFLFTDTNRLHIEDLREGIGDLKMENIVLTYVNRYSGAVKERYIMEELDISKNDLLDAVEYPLDDSVEAVRISLILNGAYAMNKLPKPIKAFVWDFYTRVTPSDKKRNMAKVFSAAD